MRRASLGEALCPGLGDVDSNHDSKLVNSYSRLIERDKLKQIHITYLFLARLWPNEQYG